MVGMDVERMKDPTGEFHIFLKASTKAITQADPGDATAADFGRLVVITNVRKAVLLFQADNNNTTDVMQQRRT
jgi:hypothetical protein